VLSTRWIINYILLVLIAALIYAGLGGDEEPANGASTGISELAPRDVEALEINSGTSLLQLKRIDDGWMIDSPVNWPAHGSVIERLLAIVDIESDALGDAAGVDLAPLGLHEPVASLRFNDSQLLFGTNNNIGARRYAMIESKVYLLPDAHLPFIAQGLTGLVDRHLLPRRYTPSVMRFADFEIRRDDSGWRSTQAKPIAAEWLAQLVANWQDLQALRVTRYRSGNAPLQVIGLELTDARKFEFVLLSREPEVVIAHPQIGLQYHFSSDSYNQLISPDSDEISN